MNIAGERLWSGSEIPIVLIGSVPCLDIQPQSSNINTHTNILCNVPNRTGAGTYTVTIRTSLGFATAHRAVSFTYQ
eukprot:SAG31_NODE_35746_length_320_cov_0.841629_1_plen_75_part_10